jgi:hypothetical protein
MTKRAVRICTPLDSALTVVEDDSAVGGPTRAVIRQGTPREDVVVLDSETRRMLAEALTAAALAVDLCEDVLAHLGETRSAPVVHLVPEAEARDAREADRLPAS